MKVLLFGGNGFLGKSLKKVLDKNNIESYTVSRSDKSSDYNVDISVFEDFDNLPTNFFNIIINCATVLPGGDYLDSNYLDKIYKTNILGSQNICKWIDKQNSIHKIINCSTLVVVSKPWATPLLEQDSNTYPNGRHVLYCSSKLTQELLFKTFADTKKIILTQIRFSTLYGESMNWSGIICNFIDQANKEKIINLTNGSSVSADFLHVDDAARIILSSIEKNIEGLLNGASGVETTILQLANIIQSNSNHFVEVNNIVDSNPNMDRALIDVGKLNKFINTNEFISVNDGIKKMMK